MLSGWKVEGEKTGVAYSWRLTITYPIFPPITVIVNSVIWRFLWTNIAVQGIIFNVSPIELRMDCYVSWLHKCQLPRTLPRSWWPLATSHSPGLMKYDTNPNNARIFQGKSFKELQATFASTLIFPLQYLGTLTRALLMESCYVLEINPHVPN